VRDFEEKNVILVRFCVGSVTAECWQEEREKLLKTRHGTELLLSDGSAPKAGDVFRNPGLAKVLEDFVLYGQDLFYKGSLASKIIEEVIAHGGNLSLEDFACHRTEFVDPISTSYRGYDIFEIARNLSYSLLTFSATERARNCGFDCVEHLGIFRGRQTQSFRQNSCYDRVPALCFCCLQPVLIV
jgi:gamma-glutamyltranspeptidase/glutathione hydrolase